MRERPSTFLSCETGFKTGLMHNMKITSFVCVKPTMAGKTACKCKNCVCLKSAVSKELFYVYIMQVLQHIFLII
jgi:hypothetical protein